jgi:hypothetical protein
MELLLVLIIAAAAVLLLGQPRAPQEPIVIYIDRTPESAEGAGGCLSLVVAAFVIGALIRLLAP